MPKLDKDVIPGDEFEYDEEDDLARDTYLLGEADEDDGFDTALCLHGEQMNRSHLRQMAYNIAKDNTEGSEYQVLSPDLRGHGDSDIDGYEPPHDVDTSCRDVQDLIHAVCIENVKQPRAVIGVGSVGIAMALRYCEAALKKETTASSHSELGGELTINMPETLILINKNTFASYRPLDALDPADATASREISKSAEDYVIEKGSVLLQELMEKAEPFTGKRFKVGTIGAVDDKSDSGRNKANVQISEMRESDSADGRMVTLLDSKQESEKASASDISNFLHCLSIDD